MVKQSLTVLLFCVLVSSCSHTVNVALRPDYENSLYPDNEIAKLETPVSFGKGLAEDKRADKTRLTTFKQGVHTYNLYEERPISEVIFEGLKTLLLKSGHQWGDSTTAEIRVDLQVLGFSAARNAGFVKVGATSGIQIKLDFVDTATNDLLYSQVYNGKDERDRALVGTMGMVEESIDASIVDCLNNVGNDTALLEALQKFKSPDFGSVLFPRKRDGTRE